MAESVFGLMSVNTNSLEIHYHEGDNMLGEVEVTKPPEIQIAEEGQVIGCGAPQNAMVTPEPLVLLIELHRWMAVPYPWGLLWRDLLHIKYSG